MKRTKEHGITLIALVITIIVLLILAGVALATLTGNSSIIDNANYAVTEYNKSANSDQNVLNQVENLFAKYMGTETKYTITYNANGGTGTMEEEEAARTATSTFTPPEGKQFKEWNTLADGSGTSYPAGAQVPSNVDLYAIWYDPLSAHVQVGDYITYDPTLGVTDASLLSYTSPAGELKVKKTQDGTEYTIYETGTETYEYSEAYVLINEDGEFEIPENSSYYLESDVSGNGYGQQTFIATADNNVWRVLDVNRDTGVIKIVPETPIQPTNGTSFNLNGLRGYKNAARELNSISAIFSHGQGINGAESITIEDVNKLTGYSEEKPTSAKSIYYTNRSWYPTSYTYEKSDYGGANGNITNMIYKNRYWLASKCVAVSSEFLDLWLRTVSADKVDYDGGFYQMYRKYGYETWREHYGGETFDDGYVHLGANILPVVSLKTTAEYLNGNGSQATPWIFQKTE